jgi:hypothetical protein
MFEQRRRFQLPRIAIEFPKLGRDLRNAIRRELLGRLSLIRLLRIRLLHSFTNSFLYAPHACFRVPMIVGHHSSYYRMQLVPQNRFKAGKHVERAVRTGVDSGRAHVIWQTS